jgi:thiamine phosphate synthase YjbQ (UPF0047 family)
MKSYRKELWFEVPTRRALINITPQVEACLKESGITEGLVLCNAMNPVFIMIMTSGLKSWRPMNRFRSTGITWEKITQMRI